MSKRWYNWPMLVVLGSAIPLLVTVGCGGPSTCGGHDRSVSENAPQILSFFVLSPDKQIPGDPWTVVFGVEFEDRDGDLGQGTSEFYLNSSAAPAAQDLDLVFRQSGIALDEPEGVLWTTLRFAEATVDDGAKVTLGLQLVDGAELRSNCYTLNLEFDVYPTQQANLGSPRWQIAARCPPARGDRS